MLALPQVKATGYFNECEITKILLGEHQLFKNLNERRGALSSPVIINFNLDGFATCQWKEVQKELAKKYIEVPESPIRRGQFRKYSSESVEIFFPHNVYPFGVLGIRNSSDEQNKELVGLSSGGLSGRVGNTLEGITQIMFDFFRCTDAMVLDEGFDVFSVSNSGKDGNPMYTNEQLLQKVCAFTKGRLDEDILDAKKMDIQDAKENKNYGLGKNLEKWPLNEALVEELNNDFASVKKDIIYDDVLKVPPLRSQMRSVLIFACREELLDAEATKETQKDLAKT